MIIYFYLFVPLLFARTDSSSIRGRNHKNDLVPFMSERSVSEKREVGREAVSTDPFFVHLRPPSSEEFENGGKAKKKKRQLKKRFSKLKSLRKRQRTRRELRIPKLKSIRGEHPISPQIPQPVNVTERLQNITNAIPKVDILKALSDHSKKIENKRSKSADLSLRDYQRKEAETAKHTALNRNHHNHHLSEPLLKMAYPSTPKTDRHPHKYTYKDLKNDRERLEEKIKYIKNMLSINDSTIDDAVRVRRKSDSDRTANRIAKMFLTLSAVNGLHDRRKSKCEEDDDEDNRVQDVWEKERKGNPFRKSSSSNEERYRTKKWIEYMKRKRSSGKTCPCMALAGEESDVFPLEQKLPKDYLLMERKDSSEESSETYRDPYYSSRDKPNRDGLSKKRLNKNQEDQDSKLKGLTKSGKKKPDMTFTDLELYRSRAKQILRNAEEILDKIKEEEEKRISSPNVFMSQLKELTSAIQGDPRNNENDLIRKLQKNLGWGPLAKPEGVEGNQFLENVKSFILDPYEKAKALTDDSTRKLSSYLLRNLGKIEDPIEERVEAAQPEDENEKIYLGQMPSQDERPPSDSLTKEVSKVDPNEAEKSEAEKEKQFKQRTEDIIKAQQMKLDEHNAMETSDESKKEMERVGDKATETVRESQEPNLADTVAIQLKQSDVDRNSESQEKATNVADEMEPEKTPAEESVLRSEGNTQEESGDNKGSASGNMPKEEKLQEEILEILKTIKEDMHSVAGDHEKVESQQKDDKGESVVQTGEELTQHKHDSGDANEQEEVQVARSSQKASEEVSERDENDVVSSPHLADDYDTLNPRENQESGQLTPLTDSYSDPSRPGETRKDPIQTKPNEETVLESQKNFEAEKSESDSSLDESKELPNLDTKETVSLAEPIVEKESMEGKEVSNNEEPEEMIQVKHDTKEPLEYADLVKQSQTSEESSDTDQTLEASPKNRSKEEVEETEKDEETLKMEQSGDKSESAGDRTNRGNTDGDTLLKLASDLEDPENVEGSDSQEDPNDATLRLAPDESAKDLENEKAVEDDQDHRESEDETPLKAENPEASKEESKDETFLKDVLEVGVQDEGEDEEAKVRAEKPAGENENQESIENEEGSNETLLKEAEDTQNSEETQLTGATNDQDQTEVMKTSFEISSDEERSNEDKGTPLQAVRDEGLEENVKTPKVGSLSQEDRVDSESSRDFNGRAKNEEGSEETLKSENNVEAERNSMNPEEKENTQEVIEESISEGNENLKLEKLVNDENDSIETTAGKKEDQQDGTLLKASDPKENLDDTTENEEVDGEGVLRGENPELKTEDETEEGSREIQTSRNEENPEETNDETALQQANPEEKAEEEQNSNERVKSASENKTEDEEEDVEEGENLKAANPDDENRNSEERGDGEGVKAASESQEEGDGDQENVKAVMENETQENLEDGAAENSQEKIEVKNSSEDGNDESVRAVLVDENQENLGENDETLKAAETEENSEIEDVLKEALESTEGVEHDETVQKGLEQDEEVMEEKAADDDETGEKLATQTENGDETYLREAINQENLMEDEDETPKEETENNESLRSTNMDDEQDKIEGENLLRQAILNAYGQDSNWGVDDERLRENSSNEVDEEQDERVESANSETGRNLNQNDHETLMEDLFGGNAAEDSPLRNANPAPPGEYGSQLSDLLQIPEATSKSTNGGRLKVPKSIAKIMNDLEGKPKDDITSIQNLNPDKIDDIIDKIGEAEQKNLLESQEVDCRKECACAEEITTRSRNIGRYEIVKDFLHWMKDLQLNRVLSDD